MKNTIYSRCHAVIACCALILISINCAYSQDTEATSIGTEVELLPAPVVEKTLTEKLDELSVVLKEKVSELSKLKAKLSKTDDDPELEADVARASQQLGILQQSFEQLAIGNINLDTIRVVTPDLTWQEELTLAIKPILENLRGLTEGPRKRENLRQAVEHQKDIVKKADKALLSIEKLLTNETSASQKSQLTLLQSKWLRIKESAEREEQLALYQLQSLSGSEGDWFTNLKDATIDFFQERGLTLALAIIVSLLIWLVLAGFRKLLDKTEKSTANYSKRTTYRIVAYTQRLLTVVLIVIGVLTVFFIRGDILLLVITLTLLFAVALGLKNVVPQFIAESRLLLNIGAVREREQVVIDGVPWRVASINLFSKFINPEIKGALRLPLSDLKDLTSRPINEERWFPSSTGDWVLDSENNLYEVINQNPLVVELQSSQGTSKLVPTPTYFSAEFVNLTKSKTIRITSVFGVGYELQGIALDEVPKFLQKVVTEHLENASLDTTEIDVRVEFSTAGSSSLDYLIIAQLGSGASKHFYRIRRVLQQACVDACNQKGWGIPFPQLTVHHESVLTDD